MMGKYKAVSDSFYKAIAQSIYQSIESQQVDIFKSLNNFLLERLNANYQTNDIDTFSSFANLFVYYYEYSVNKYRDSMSTQEIHEVCSDSAGRDIKDIIKHKFAFSGEHTHIKDKQKNNQYSDVLLSKFGDVIYTAIKYKDFKRFGFFLNQLQQISSGYNRDIYKEFEVANLKKSQLDAQQQQHLIFLETHLEANSYVDTIVRRTFKVIRFWVYYLYDNDILSYDDLREIDNMFNQYNSYIEFEQLDDLYYLRASSFGHDNYWNRWDYMERPEMEVYTPPSVLHWITFGSLVYFLKNDAAISYDINDRNPQHINSFEYLISSMSEILRDLEKNGYSKWNAVFGTPSKELFEKRIQSFRSQIDYLRQVNVTEKERAIADLPLHAPLVNSFKNVLIDGWKKKNLIRELFAHFNNINGNVPKNELLVLGDENKIKEGWKKCFIKNDNYYVSIGNVNLYGHELSKIEERVFVRQILNEEKIIVENWLVGINEAISTLKNNRFNPSIILLSHNLWQSIFSNFKSPDFKLNWSEKEEFVFSEYGGFYKEIPILPMRNDFFKDNIIVADFFESFIVNQYMDNGHPLTINIELITEAEAKEIVDRNTGYWQQNDLSQDQAVIKVRNAVKFDFYTLLSFKIKERNAFVILSNQPIQ